MGSAPPGRAAPAADARRPPEARRRRLLPGARRRRRPARRTDAGTRLDFRRRPRRWAMELAMNRRRRLMAPGSTGAVHADNPRHRVAGAFGGVSRHLLEAAVNRHRGDDFPWGTFTVNVSGSFVLGLLIGVFAHRLNVPLWLQAGATVGFLGAYTTFSTLSMQVY